MEFKINEDFAKHYNEYRQKEEYMKLKSRFGDVKISKKRKLDEEGEGVKSDESGSDSSSSESSSSNEEVEEAEHADFLRLYDALCRNDPALNDSNKTWFRDSSDKSTVDAEIHDARKKQKPVLLKDHTREFLLSHGGLEDDEHLSETKSISKQDILVKLKDKDTLKVKQAFLSETEPLFEEDDTQLLLKRSQSNENEKSDKKLVVDVSHFSFHVSGSKENEDFLRDYLVNRRWKQAKIKNMASSFKRDHSPDALADEILSLPKMASGNSVDKKKELPNSTDLDEDDDFLLKSRQFEARWNSNDEDLVKEYPNTSAARFRFEEDDREYIKTYPRQIEGTLRQPMKDSMTRAEKRRLRAERKQIEKARKMAELKQLKRLKMAEFAKKLELIRRTCGDGVPSLTADHMDEEVEGNEILDEVIGALEDDWNPEEHDKLVQKLFNNEYYSAATQDENLDEPPAFSDNEDDGVLATSLGTESLDKGDYDEFVVDRSFKKSYNNEEQKTETDSVVHSQASAMSRAAKELQENMAPRKRGKRALIRSRLQKALDMPKPIFDPATHPDFEKYFDEFYKLECEDIITGSEPGENIHCRFKYREVKPNDFGLTTEEILAADEKELNRYVSVKVMSAYRTNDEEERDLYKFHSKKMQQKKLTLIPSLSKLSEKVPTAIAQQQLHDEDLCSKLSRKAIKRLRKKEKKAHLPQSFSAANKSEPLLLPETRLDEKNGLQVVKTSSLLAKAAEASRQSTTQTAKKEQKSGNCSASRREQQVGQMLCDEIEGAKTAPKSKKSLKPKLSDERLRAAGIDPKQFRYIKSKRLQTETIQKHNPL